MNSKKKTVSYTFHQMIMKNLFYLSTLTKKNPAELNMEYLGLGYNKY